MPWDQLEAVVEPFYPKAAMEERPLSAYLPWFSRLFKNSTALQHWYKHEDPAMEDALYWRSTSMRLFTDLPLDIPITYLD